MDRPRFDRRALSHVRATSRYGGPSSVRSDWRLGLPVLAGADVVLREVEPGDAAALHELLTTAEVARFMSAPPDSSQGFEPFISWVHRERAAGRHACFAVVPAGESSAAGLFQVRALEPGFGTAEWGFAIGSRFWGGGVFLQAARLVVDFAIETLSVHRLEARAAVSNGRGNGALRKLGAVQEGVLRRSFTRHGRHIDQVLWSILADDWRQARTIGPAGVIH